MNYYDANFYASQSAGSYRSATMVVPHIINLYKPSKIADIGGGVGTWCKAFEELGVDATCFDGAYVAPECSKFIVKYTINYTSGKKWFDERKVYGITELGAKDVIYSYNKGKDISIISVEPTYEYTKLAVYGDNHTVGER